MADAIYTQALTYTTPAGVKVSVGDLVIKRDNVGIVTGIKRYGTGRWQICFEYLNDIGEFTRTTWGHMFGKYEYCLHHFNHKGT